MSRTTSHIASTRRVDRSLHMDLWMIVTLAAAFGALEQIARLL